MVTPKDKEDLVTKQMKDIAQVWYNKWKGQRLVGVGPVEWEVFKSAFLESLFSLELREAKIKEIINLYQVSMSVKDYALKFTQFYKYAPTVVADSSAKMSRFLTSMFDIIEKECHMAIILHDINISRLMVYSLQVDIC